MKRILVILCSPRRDGFTEFLADGFLKGATQAGAEVRKISVRGKKLLPCRHCCYCGEHGGQCGISHRYGLGGFDCICLAPLFLDDFGSDEDYHRQNVRCWHCEQLEIPL